MDPNQAPATSGQRVEGKVNEAARLRLLNAVGLLILLGLGARLYALTVSRHAELRRRADTQSRRAEIKGPLC